MLRSIFSAAMRRAGRAKFFGRSSSRRGPVATTANIAPSNGAMNTAVGQDKDAIGYVSIGHVDESVKALSIDGAAASQENAMNGSYPVVRKLYMNTKGEPSKPVKAFIDYIMSPEGAEIIKKHGYIPFRRGKERRHEKDS